MTGVDIDDRHIAPGPHRDLIAARTHQDRAVPYPRQPDPPGDAAVAGVEREHLMVAGDDHPVCGGHDGHISEADIGGRPGHVTGRRVHRLHGAGPVADVEPRLTAYSPCPHLHPGPTGTHTPSDRPGTGLHTDHRPQDGNGNDPAGGDGTADRRRIQRGLPENVAPRGRGHPMHLAGVVDGDDGVAGDDNPVGHRRVHGEVPIDLTRTRIHSRQPIGRPHVQRVPHQCR